MDTPRHVTFNGFNLIGGGASRENCLGCAPPRQSRRTTQGTGKAIHDFRPLGKKQHSMTRWHDRLLDRSRAHFQL